jgi:site-specific DNA recombinase
MSIYLGLAALLGATESGEIGAVIVSELSRVGRNTKLVLGLVEQLTAHGVALLSCKESLDTTTSTGQFVLTMFAALAQLERDQISERTRYALAELRRAKGDRGGSLPYGYARTPTGIVIVPELAQVACDIFLLREGQTLRQIADTLNAVGTPGPRGGRWHHTSVREVLLNEGAYRGGRIGDSELTWPLILPDVAA